MCIFSICEALISHRSCSVLCIFVEDDGICVRPFGIECFGSIGTCQVCNALLVSVYYITIRLGCPTGKDLTIEGVIAQWFRHADSKVLVEHRTCDVIVILIELYGIVRFETV